MIPSDVSPENRKYYELFDRCNHTELYQIAKRNGFDVSPTSTRDELIRVIIYEAQPLPHNFNIDEWRRAIMRFVIDHRKKLETQLTCPARSFKEDACFRCVDARVTHCLTVNGNEGLKLIERYKK